MKKILFPFFSFIILQSSYSQKIISLYKDKIPNSKPFAIIEKSDTDKNGIVIIKDISIPTLTIFLPPKIKANGTAVIICPGGGYYVNAFKHEGTDVAKEFVKKGVAAFVLKYRIPDERWMINTAIGPLQDAEKAMIIIRNHAKQWNVDTAKIGVMGFSAGGHLASTLATHYDEAVIDNPVKMNLRPAFSILVYPYISSDPVINGKNNMLKLVGKNADSILLKQYSNETRVTYDTPPSIIIQSTNDDLSVKNSLVFYEVLIKNKVKAEMHLYQGGGHGYGLNNKTTKDKWIERCFNWMDANGWLKRSLSIENQ